MTWVSLGVVLACFGSFWVNFVGFGSLWDSLNFISGRIASLCLVSSLFGLFWLVLGCFGSF